MKFYVYTLTDPRTGRVFYVGKGQGERMYQHEKEARGGRVSRKCGLIREILADGYSLRYATVSRHFDEAEAYQAEAALIEEIGLRNLTNLKSGFLTWSATCRGSFYTMRWLRRAVPTLAIFIMGLKKGNGSVVVEGVDLTEFITTTIQGFVRELGAEVVLSVLCEYRDKLKARKERRAIKYANLGESAGAHG